VSFTLVWCSAKQYYAHEPSIAAKKHFGHHEHKQQAGGDIVKATDDVDNTVGGFHPDCETWSLTCSAFVPVVVLAVLSQRTNLAARPRSDGWVS